MNNALSKIMEATNAFNLEMANASEEFNRLAGSQEFLMAAVEAAKAYAKGHGNLPRVEVGSNIIADGVPDRNTTKATADDLPTFLREAGPIVAANEENNEQLTFNPQNPEPLRPADEQASEWPSWAEEVERKLAVK